MLMLLATALVWLLTATPAWADFKSDYSKGLEAVKAGSWAEAERLMSAAAEGNPKEGRVRLYGMHFEPYIPNYYVGLARFQMGDCPGALRAWAVSESQGFITKLPEYGDLQAHRAACQERLASVQPTAPPAPKVPDRSGLTHALQESKAGLQAAEAAATRLTDLRKRGEYRPVWSSDAAFPRRSEDAAGILEQARAKLQAGERSSNEADLAAAATLAQQAAAAYEGIRQDLEQRYRQAKLAARRSPTPERRALSVSPTPEPSRPPIPTPSPAPGATREARLEPSPTRGASLEPPASIKTAAAAFFNADYEKTLAVLEGVTFTDRRAVATSHLLRAAASYALYLRDGEKEQKMRETALAQARLCLRVRPSTRLDPSLFSPRIAALFAEAR